MTVLKINVFKNSFGPIIKLFNDHNLAYQMREQRSVVISGSSQIIEVIVNASVWVSLASVIITFIRAKNNRQVLITTKDKKIIHAKGLDSKQLEKILEQAQEISAIDPGQE